MTDRGRDEVKCDAHAVAVRLRLAVDAEDWGAVGTLCARLQEHAARLHHEEETRARLARVRAMQPYGLPE